MTVTLAAALLFAALLPPLSLALCAIVLSFSLVVYAPAAPLSVVAPPRDVQRVALLALALLRAPPSHF